MVCPECKEEAIMSEIPFIHARDYGSRCSLVRVDCCGNLVLLRSELVFELDKYEGEETEDHWGN